MEYSANSTSHFRCPPGDLTAPLALPRYSNLFRQSLHLAKRPIQRFKQPLVQYLVFCCETP